MPVSSSACHSRSWWHRAKAGVITPMHPLRTYDYLCRSRARVLDAVRTETPEQHACTFPIGPGSIAKTLTHMVVAEWYYIQRMLQREVPPDDQWEIQENSPPPFAVLQAVWATQAMATRAALESVRDWDAPIEYRVTPDDGKPVIVTCSAMDLFTQLALHEVHHRSQVLNMLRQLGITIAGGDLDFNAMMMPRRPA